MNKEAVIKVNIPQDELVATKVADSFEEAVDLCLEAIEQPARKTQKRLIAISR